MGKRFTHKILSMFLALAVIVTYMPFASMLGDSNTAYAASYSGTLKQSPTGNKLSGKAVEIHVVRYNSKMDSTDEAYMETGVCIESGEGEPIHKFEIATKSNDVLVYCVEHGVAQRSDKLTAKKLKKSYYGTYFEKNYRQSLRNMQKVMMFAPVTGSTFSELKDLGYKGSGNMNAWIAASQALIWECGQLMRTDKNFTLKANGLYYQSYRYGPRTKPIPAKHFYNCLDEDAKSIYRFMEKEIKKYEKFDKSIASDGRHVASGGKRKLRSEKPRVRERTEKNTESTVRDDQ